MTKPNADSPTADSPSADAPTGDDIVRALTGRGTPCVKLGITDIDGVIRGKYLTMDKFASAAADSAGFCDCIFGWDINDQLYDNVSFSSWSKGFPDVPYRLDPASMRELPFEDGTPYFIAELIPPGDQPFHPLCPRNVLKRVLAQLADAGFAAHIAFEYEFFLFDESPRSLREKAYRDPTPITPGNFGYSVLRSSVHGDMHRAFIQFCHDMRLELEGYHTETGPGVLEAAIKVQPALEGADRASLFKTFAKVFFQRHGITPTFMAKWSPAYPGQSGHLHISLTPTGGGDNVGDNVFWDPDAEHRMSATMRPFVAGLVEYMPELCALVAPTVNSYTRLVKGAWAPTAATWGVDNRTCAVRAIPGSRKSQRVEYRLAAADGNPYLVAAAALASGLEGIARGLDPEPPVIGDAYDIQDSLPAARALPRTLTEASARFRASAVARARFGDEFVDHFAATRDWEWREFCRAITDWELARYFEIV